MDEPQNLCQCPSNPEIAEKVKFHIKISVQHHFSIKYFVKLFSNKILNQNQTDLDRALGNKI